jgi:carboxyl-terminal processing protease
LNYAKKDASGKAIKTDAKNYNAFKTRGGRTVYDGGGIQPDVELEESKKSAITDALSKNDAVFDFATQWVNKNSAYRELSDADFTQFKAYLKAKNFSFDTKTEQLLKETLEQAKKDKLDGTIKPQYDQLMAAIQKAEESELDQNKTEILNQLRDELILRYQYKEGLYQYYLKSNSEIKKATQLLNSAADYNKILKKQ